MNKRSFLKLSSAMIVGSAISPLACKPGREEKSVGETIKNWAGNRTYSTKNIFRPATVEEVSDVVRKCNKLRVLGTRHCFNGIADSTDNLLSTENLNEIISVDEKANTVTVGSGIRYGELCTYLHDRGYALHNLASLPHISIAGACATATHGSGVKNGNLSKAISAIELVTAAGEVMELSREKDPAIFPGVVVNLGALGVVTKVTLDLVPAFTMRQDVYFGLPVDELGDHFDEIMSSGYSVSLFTDWQTSRMNQLWIKRVISKDEPLTTPEEYFGAMLATKNVHPIIEISAENCTDQLGVPGPWYERLPHFKMGFTPSSGEELQAEYFVPRQHAVDAIRAVQTLHEEIRPYLMITEIRTIDEDDMWMSPCYHQPSVAIHFTLTQDMEGVNNLLPKIEEKLSTFNAKPHWGKLFSLSPATLRSRYEKMGDFQKLVKELDPAGKFVNEFIAKNILNV
jgi:xylitol oxidase